MTSKRKKTQSVILDKITSDFNMTSHGTFCTRGLQPVLTVSVLNFDLHYNRLLSKPLYY